MRVLNQILRVAVHVHMYECVKLVCVTHVSDACHTRLPLNLSPVYTVIAICYQETSWVQKLKVSCHDLFIIYSVFEYLCTKSSDMLNKNSLAVKKCEANQKAQI